MNNFRETTASKAYAMNILANIAEDEPDLTGELFAVIDFQYKNAPAGIKSKTRNIQKRFM